MRNEITLLLLVLNLLWTINLLSSQEMSVTGMAHVYYKPYAPDPFEELDLLSDNPSYYVFEELFNADTLTRKGLRYAFYNFGDNRYFFSTSTDKYENYQEIVHYNRLNDSFAIQISNTVGYTYKKIDTVLIWFNNGMIQRAIKIMPRGKRIEYQYHYNEGLLVEKTISTSPFGHRHYRYTYADGLLKSTEVINGNGSVFISEYSYSDTLNVETNLERQDSNINKSITNTRLDSLGRIQSIKSYAGIRDTTNLQLSFSAEVEFIGKDGYKKTFFHKVNEQTSSMEYFSNDELTSTRYLWEGYDQVWILKRYNL